MPTLDPADARRRLASARVATLGTTSPAGEVDLVPITFAVDGDRLVSAVDHKPKTTVRLQRLDNIEANPRVTVLAHRYDEDWDELWWVRVRGEARVVSTGQLHRQAVDALVAKYPQLVDNRPTGPVIVVEIDDWLAWTARRSDR
jgi:PPOX class probable F420-dependent enzyme